MLFLDVWSFGETAVVEEPGAELVGVKIAAVKLEHSQQNYYGV